MAAAENPLPREVKETSCEDSRGLILKNAANELVFAVVGHVGSGTSDIAVSLKEGLVDQTLPDGPFEVHILKARDVIREWAREQRNPSRRDKAKPRGYRALPRPRGFDARSEYYWR